MELQFSRSLKRTLVDQLQLLSNLKSVLCLNSFNHGLYWRKPVCSIGNNWNICTIISTVENCNGIIRKDGAVCNQLSIIWLSYHAPAAFDVKALTGFDSITVDSKDCVYTLQRLESRVCFLAQRARKFHMIKSSIIPVIPPTVLTRISCLFRPYLGIIWV